MKMAVKDKNWSKTGKNVTQNELRCNGSQIVSDIDLQKSQKLAKNRWLMLKFQVMNKKLFWPGKWSDLYTDGTGIDLSLRGVGALEEYNMKVLEKMGVASGPAIKVAYLGAHV